MGECKGHLQQEWVLGEGTRAPMPVFLFLFAGGEEE